MQFYERLITVTSLVNRPVIDMKSLAEEESENHVRMRRNLEFKTLACQLIFCVLFIAYFTGSKLDI